METWEGPHNVLLTQAARDLVRLRVDVDDFVAGVAGRGDAALAAALEQVVRGADADDALLAMPELAGRIVDALGDRVLGAS